MARRWQRAVSQIIRHYRNRLFRTVLPGGKAWFELNLLHIMGLANPRRAVPDAPLDSPAAFATPAMRDAGIIYGNRYEKVFAGKSRQEFRFGA